MSLLITLFFSMHINATESITVVGSKPEEDLVLDPKTSEQPELSELLLTLPNVSLTSGANRPRFFQVRGVGETSQFEHSQVRAFGLFYEGIDLSEEGSALPLLGRESARVRYGPQSRDWGGKALAGALEVDSCLARACSLHRWEGSAANYATHGLSGGSRWRSDSLEVFTGLAALSSDGFYRNTYLDRSTTCRNEFDSVLGLAYTLGEARVREHHLFVRHGNGYDSWNHTPGFETRSDHPGRDHHQVHGHSFDYEVDRWRGLTSLTVTQQEEAYDEDWGYDTSYNYFSEFERRRFKFHQKMEHHFDEDLWAGIHYYSFDERQLIRSYKDESLRRQTEPRSSTRNLGLWLKKEVALRDWSIGTGARVEKQWIELEGLGDRLSETVEPQWSADLRVRREANEFLFARGFRGAGYNTTPELNRDLLFFGPEEIYLAQFTHGEARSGMIRAFYQWRHRQQVRSSVQTDLMDPSTFTYFTENQGSSRGFGVETLAARAWGRWKLSGSVGWMQSRFRDRELPQAPTWTYSARIEYAPSDLGAYLQVSGRDAYFFADDHDFRSKPYHLVDAGTSYRWDEWRLGFWVRNLFDQEYPVRAFYFANEPPAWEPKYYTQLGDPRTFGAQLVFEYR